jgi:hypothetical protein
MATSIYSELTLELLWREEVVFLHVVDVGGEDVV